MNKNFLRIFAILLAITFWLNKTLLQVHTVNLELPVTFENLPKELVIVDPLENLSITVKGKGKDIFFAKYLNSNINIDASSYQYWNNLLKISKDNIKFPEFVNLRITDIGLKKNIMVRTDKVTTTKKPIEINYESKKDQKLLADLQKKKSFDYVDVSGPQKTLKDISSILTEPISEKEITKNKKYKVSLIKPNENLQLSLNEILIEFTEENMVTKTISGIEIDHPENEYSILPKTISVIIEGNKKIIETVGKDNISAKIDTTTINNGTAEIRPRIPQNVKLIEFTPEYVQIIN